MRMSDEENKSRLHIHTGGLIILIIIILILFKVDIKSKIKSEQFQKNATYIEDEAKEIWQKYISDPLKSKAGGWFTNFTDQQVKKMQENFSNNILKTTDIEKE